MRLQFKIWSILFLTSLLNYSEANATSVDEPEAYTTTEQTAGRDIRFTQFELDVAFRLQSDHDISVYNRNSEFNYCCTLFYQDIRMLSQITQDFSENVRANLEHYAIQVFVSEDVYEVYFTERYRESTQYESDGFWYPGIGEAGEVRVYGYIVDRSTLETLEFSELAR